MDHRISAGLIIEQDNRILLVRHRRPGVYDFWAAPGGGAQGAEELAQGELESRQVFPEVLVHQYWQDREQALVEPRYLGLRKMAFW